MKVIQLVIILFAITKAVSAQNFEGKITYQNTIKSKIAQVSSEQFTSMIGTTLEYYVKGGDYKTVANGTTVQWQLYINHDNRLYNKTAASPLIFWNDGSVNSDEVIKSELNKNLINILGHQCDELVLTCKSGIQKYYFSADIKFDATPYNKHKYGNWNVIMAKTHSLPLKMIIDNPQMTFESEATEVKETRLDGAFFQLPADSKIERSPY